MSEALARHIAATYDGLIVEIGVGERPELAERLAREPHLDVVATDVEPRSVDAARFVRDDVTDPDLDVYRDAAAIYSLRPPPELHRPIARLAGRVDADAIVVPFGNDTVTVDHRVVASDGASFCLLETSNSP